MASQIEAIDIKRKMFFEHEGAPYHCIDVEVSKPTARGCQTLVRIKMRNLLTRAVFDKTFKAGDRFKEPNLSVETASYLYADASGYRLLWRMEHRPTSASTSGQTDSCCRINGARIVYSHVHWSKYVGFLKRTHYQIVGLLD